MDKKLYDEKTLLYIDDLMSEEEKIKFEKNISPSTKKDIDSIKLIRKSMLSKIVDLPVDYEKKLKEKLSSQVIKNKEKNTKKNSGFFHKITNLIKNRTISIVAASFLIILVSVPILKNISRLSGTKEASEASKASEIMVEESIDITKGIMASKNKATYEQPMSSNSIKKSEEPTMIASKESSSDSVKDEVRSENNNYSGRLIIVNSRFRITTDDYKLFYNKIEDLVSKTGGYISNKEVHVTNSFYKNEAKDLTSGYIELRIPNKSLNSAYEKIKQFGRIDSENIYTEDITSMYRDSEQRKTNLETREKALRKLMAKANDIKDIIIIEKELSNVRYEIESIAGRLKKWENLVDMSKITIDFEEVHSLTPEIKPVNYGFFQKIKNTFIDSINNIIYLIEKIIILIVYNLINIIVILIAAFFIRKKIIDYKDKNKKGKENE